MDDEEFQEGCGVKSDEVAKQFIRNNIAWGVVCKEYGVDPDRMIQGLSIGMLEVVKIVLAEIFEYNPEPSEYQLELNNLRQEIDMISKEWD